MVAMGELTLPQTQIAQVAMTMVAVAFARLAAAEEAAETPDTLPLRLFLRNTRWRKRNRECMALLRWAGKPRRTTRIVRKALGL